MALNILIDILKYTLSGWLIVLGAYFLFKNNFKNSVNRNKSNVNSILSKDMIGLKLQSYERLTLFIERINPVNLFVRLYQPSMQVTELHALALAEIRAEYQHNITQQLYVNTDTWVLIKRVKDDTIAIINASAKQLKPEITAIDLSKLVFNRLSALDESPYNLALNVIKAEMGEL